MATSSNGNHVDPAVSSGTSPTAEADFICENHGSLFLLRPLSPAAFEWIEENLPDDRLIFGNATVIEPRYVGAILFGLRDDGLVVAQ